MGEKNKQQKTPHPPTRSEGERASECPHCKVSEETLKRLKKAGKDKKH